MSWFRGVLAYLQSNPALVLWAFLLFTLGNSIFAIAYLNTLEANFSRIYQEDLRGGDALQNTQTTLLLLDSELKDALILTGKTNFLKLQKTIDAKVKALNSSLARASVRLTTKSEKALLVTLKGQIATYLSQLKALYGLAEAGETIPDEEVQALNSTRIDLEQTFQKMDRKKVDDARKTFNDVEFQLHFSMAVTLATLVVTIIIRFVGHHRKRKALSGS